VESTAVASAEETRAMGSLRHRADLGMNGVPSDRFGICTNHSTRIAGEDRGRYSVVIPI
jgi:hypothetical protein